MPKGSHGSLLPPYSVYPRSRTKTKSGRARLLAEGNQLLKEQRYGDQLLGQTSTSSNPPLLTICADFEQVA